MSQTFNCNQFRLALITTSKIKTSLQPFLQQFQKNNIPWIFAAISELTQYLSNPKIQPNLTLNSLIAVKFILDQADILMTHLVEIYLLPTIFQIASFKLQKGQETRDHTYFISKGYKGEKDNLESLAFHFVRMACEIIITVSQIKPKMVCFNEQLQEHSEFQFALQKMKKMGLESYKSFMYYQHIIIKQARKRFIKNLQLYYNDILPFKQYCEVFIKDYLAKGLLPLGTISPFKLLEKGEATAIDLVVKQCLKSLLSTNLSERTRALKLMSDMIIWGDITVAYLINSQGPINELVNQICVDKQKKLGKQRALVLFDKYQNSQQAKEQYYKELLKSIKLWGKCYPTAINSIDKVSNVKYLCGQLQKKGVQFPQYDQVYTEEALFQSNRRKKIRMNEKLFNYMQKNQGQEKVSIVNVYIEQTRSFIYQRQITFEKFSEEIQMVRETLNKICQSQDKIDDYMQILNKFCRDFDLNIEKGQFNNADLQFIINEGVPLIERTERIMPYLQLYQDKIIQFDVLRTTLSQHNKELTFSQVYEQYRQSKFLQSTNLQDDIKMYQNINRLAISYRLDLLPQPKIDLTQSHQLTLQQILKQKYKSKVNFQKKPSNSLTNKSISGNQDALFNFSMENMMQSKQVIKKISPNCLKLMSKLQSLSLNEDFSGFSYKFQQQKRQSRVF